MVVQERLFFYFVFAALTLVYSCGSLPAPEAITDSLVVVVITESEDIVNSIRLERTDELAIRGPINFNIGIASERWAIRTFRCVSGTYKTEITLADKTVKAVSLEVFDNTIVLFPLAFHTNADGTMSAIAVGPAEREQAVRMLSDFVSYDRWIGKDFVGFGPFRPRMFLSGKRYTLDVACRVEGSRVFIDGDEWGNTPIWIPLPRGKYLVSVEHEGYSAYKKYLAIEKDTHIDALLVKTEKQEPGAAQKERFSLLVTPLVNLGSAGDAVYGTVFLDSFAVNFKDDKRLVVYKQTAADGVSVGTIPDYRASNESGADLLITGSYLIRGNKLFVWAGLYDVKSERTKLAIVDTGDAGVKVFETVDRITANFSEAVAKTLPNPGEPVIVQEKEMTESRVEYEKLLFRKDVVDRISGHMNILGLTIGFFGPNPPGLLTFRYERVMTKEFALSASVGLGFGSGLAIDLFAGPQIVFKTGGADLYCALLGCYFYHSLSSDYYVSNSHVLGLDLETGLKVYLSSTKSGLPSFLTIGMTLDAINYEFPEDWSDATWIPMSGQIFVGGGIGL